MIEGARLQDIRLLKLAEMYENAYERFVVELATRVVQDPDVRAELMRLVDPADDHAAKIVEHLNRLNADVTPAEKLDVEIAAVQDVVEVEKSARDFYFKHVDRAHDPHVAQLFVELAHAETRHAQIAEHALHLAKRHAHAALTDAAQHANLDAVMPLWEGTGDYGSTGYGLPPPIFHRKA